MEKHFIGNNFLKNIMLGLIYPAILGNIIYITLTVLNNRVIFEHEAFFNIKFTLLLITAAFYFFDYLYIYFTYNFKWWMFFLNVIFAGTLFLTFQKIHLNMNEGEAKLAPEIFSILCFYLIYIVLYFAWDFYEKTKTINFKEKYMYKWIVRWEAFSIILLLICIFLYDQSKYLTKYRIIFSIIILSVLTISFGLFDIWKYKFWRDHISAKNEKHPS